MRAVLTMFLLFAALMLAIPAAAAAMIRLPEESGYEYSQQETVKQSGSVSEAENKTFVFGEEEDEKELLLESFLILDRTSGKISEVKRRDFIRGAVASEMPASFDEEALSAQAVAAHTWAVSRALSPDPSLGGAHFSADPSNDEGYITKERFFERYGDSAEEAWEKICSAADFADKRLLLYEGEPALCAYHAMSAGVTEAADEVWQTSLPYLVPVVSEGDSLSENCEKVTTFGTAQMRTLLTLSFPTAILGEDPEEWIEITERSESGYVTEVKVGGAVMHGQKLRTALSLRSTCMAISYKDGVFAVTTRGYGHGVGMSQVGADYMAREGSSAKEILLHYYPGTKLVKQG